MSADLQTRLSSIQGLVLDVDGVLTDGQITYTDDGHELKSFHVQDGASLKLLAEHGVALAIITGRRSPIVARRARELGIKHVEQGARSKPDALANLIEAGFPSEDLAAIGDDIQDLALQADNAISVFMTVANAHPAVLAAADHVTERRGGDGVIVEIAELMLRAQNKWPF